MADLFRYRKLIEAINEEQSFSRAAQKLFMPQPSLSVIVKKLEEEIGMPLFDRTTKPIRLTDAGREYLRTAQEIDLSEKAFENYIDSINQLQMKVKSQSEVAQSCPTLTNTKYGK